MYFRADWYGSTPTIGNTSPTPITVRRRYGTPSGLHRQLAEGDVEAVHGALDVAQLVQAEEPDAKRPEIGRFIALQGHAGRGLQSEADQLAARLNPLVVGIADNDTGRLVSRRCDAPHPFGSEQPAHLVAKRL